MQMKKKIYLTGLLLGTTHGCITTESKHASMQWKHLSSSSAAKFMLTVFWDSQGVLLAHFEKRSENVNAGSYCEVLLKFRVKFAGNVHANWQEEYCFIMAIPNPI
jgi:hypothetical protein